MNNTLHRKKKTWITSAHRGFVSSGIHSNTIAAYRLAASKGADMIELDARMTKDGVLIVNHDATVKGYTENGVKVEYVISETNYEEISKLSLLEDRTSDNHIPTLSEALHFVYFSGLSINIDLKEGILHAKEVSEMVVSHGMRGRTVYATNGAGAECIKTILTIDPQARFIDTKANFTKEKLETIENYPAKCYVYTSDFSDKNISEIRESGCMLATISLTKENVRAAFKHHPDMAEYPHTSDFSEIDKFILSLEDL